MEGPRAGTHRLKSRGHSVLEGVKQKDQGKALTNWRAQDMVCQQAQNRATKDRHSLAEEKRT
jgi:hypothetical protein